jgi:hypothetical protein
MHIKLIDLLRELSATGTGATAVPGEGEGMATKYAFAGPGGTKAKRKKGLIVKKQLNEAGIEDEIENMSVAELEKAYLAGEFDNNKELLQKVFELVKEKSAAERKLRKSQPDNAIKPGELAKITFKTKQFIRSTSNRSGQAKEVTIYRKLNKEELDKLSNTIKASQKSGTRPAFTIEKSEDFADEGTSDIYKILYKGQKNYKVSELDMWTILSDAEKEKIDSIKKQKGLTDDDFKLIKLPIEDVIKYATQYTDGPYIEFYFIIKGEDNLLDKIENIVKGKQRTDYTADKKETEKEKEVPEPPKDKTKVVTTKTLRAYATDVIKKDQADKTGLNKIKASTDFDNRAKSMLKAVLKKDNLSDRKIEDMLANTEELNKFLEAIRKYKVPTGQSVAEANMDIQKTSSDKDEMTIIRNLFYEVKKKTLELTFKECISNPEKLDTIDDYIERITQKLSLKMKEMMDADPNADETDTYKELDDIYLALISLQNLLSYNLKKAFREANKSYFNTNYNK